MRTLRNPHLTLLAIALLGTAPAAGAQVVEGAVVDTSQHPLPGVVVMLLDSTNKTVARALTGDQGTYRMRAARSGTYHIRSARIGFRPSLTPDFVLSASETKSVRIRLSGIGIALDTMHVVASNSCRETTDQGGQVFAVLEQARTALQATALSDAAGTLHSVTLDYERELDPAGRRVTKQSTSVRTLAKAEPWTPRAPDSLHARGYVIRDGVESTTYYAPGLDMLASELFVSDHCFALHRESNRLGVSFEPNSERRDIAEIRGTIWLDLATARLQSLEFRYVNLPFDIDAAADAGLAFARLPDGEWAITNWHIRMPVLERRVRSQTFGGDAFVVRQMTDQGGELMLASRGKDTLYAAPSRVFRGTLLDSITGNSLSGARLQVSGLRVSSVADDRGRFELHGLLPGEYDIDVHSASLDSIGSSYHLIAILKDDTPFEARVPSGALFMRSVCGYTGAGALTGVFGSLTVSGGARVPADAQVRVAWRTPKIQVGAGVAVNYENDHRDARPDSSGAYRVCDLPAETDLAVSVESDSAVTNTASVRLHDTERFHRVDLVMDRSAAAFATFTGMVRRDSLQVPVAAAEVALPELGRFTTTDSLGRFRLGDIPPGAHRVVVRKLGLLGVDTTLSFVRAQSMHLEASLKKTQVLKAVKTLATSLPPSFDDHLKMGLGSFITRTDLEKQEGRKLGNVVETLRGARVVATVGAFAYMTSARRPDCTTSVLCDQNTYSPTDYEKLHGIRARCYSQVWLDGVLLNKGRPTEPFDVNTISVETLEAVEYYAGPSETPIEYSQFNSTCGVLVLWTRRTP